MTAKQIMNGKAFEYALLLECKEKLQRYTNVEIIKNNSFEIAKKYFETFNQTAQSSYQLTASFAINSLIDLEPRLSNGINDDDILQLELAQDSQGEIGDVRDILMIRLL